MASSVSCGYALWLDGGTYNGLLGRTFHVAASFLNTGAAQVYGGVLPSGGQLDVTAGSGMHVHVATGYVLCPSSAGSTSGGYLFGLMTATNLDVAGSDPTNPRIDLVVAYVDDVGTSSSFGAIEVLSGVATSGATLGNLLGAPLAPTNSQVLAYVLVPATSASVSGGDIAVVSQITVAQGGILPVDADAAPAGYTGMYIHDLDSGSLQHNPATGPEQTQVLPFTPARADRTATINSVLNNPVTVMTVSIDTDGSTDIECIVKWPSLSFAVVIPSGPGAGLPYSGVLILEIDGNPLYEQYCLAPPDGQQGGSFTHVTQSGTDRPAAGAHTVTLVLSPQGDGAHNMFFNCTSTQVASLYVRPAPL